MSALKMLDRLRAKQAENLAARDPLTPGEVPPADGLQRRNGFIMPTRETLPAYAAHFDAKAGSEESSPPDRQTVTAAELLAAHRTIKPTLKKSLTAIDLHELALTLAIAAKREKSLTSDETRPARVFHPRDVYQPENGKGETTDDKHD
jgi:hypothetical protein